MTPKDPMARDFHDLCKDSTHEWTTHPSLEQLALYLRQELEADQQEQLRDHVTFCKTCQKELLGLQSFRELVDESTRLADLGRCPPGLPEENGACSKTEMERVWDDVWFSLGDGGHPKGVVDVSSWPQWNLAMGWTRISIVVLLTAFLTWSSVFITSWSQRVFWLAENPLCETSPNESCVLSAPCLEGVSKLLWRPWVLTLKSRRGVEPPDFSLHGLIRSELAECTMAPESLEVVGGHRDPAIAQVYVESEDLEVEVD